MLGTLSTYALASAPRRVEPPGAALRLTEALEAAAPPRLTASDTDNAAIEALARESGAGAKGAIKNDESLAARLARATLEAGDDPVETPPPESETPAGGLSDAERDAVDRMADRDREVRAHEMAHVIAGRPWAGPPVYMYQMGPDGRRYAIGGFVPIDVTEVKGDPQATVYKMRVVSDAALAPVDPSAADRRVAAIAQAKLQEALAAISSQSRAIREGASPEEADAAAASGLNIRI